MLLPESQRALWAQYLDDKVLIVGFTERTGLAVARVFDEVGVRYAISDTRPREEIEPLLQGLSVEREDVLCGEQTEAQLDGIDRIILSPGVPRRIVLVQAAQRRGIPVSGDIDFLYEFVCHKRLVGITGTDGKTTTTQLVAAGLERAGKVVMAGNIGVPVFAKYGEILDCDFVVLELSSFMLENVQRFRADFSCILNLAEDHVDRYGSQQDYAAAKFNLVRHARPGDVFVRNVDDARLRELAAAHARSVTISAEGADADYTFAGGVFQVRGQSLQLQECRLQGIQNAENILAAAAIGCEAGVEPSVVVEAIRSSAPLAHRFEDAGVHAGVRVINDSKATTVHAVSRALDNFERGVVLIAGGRDKDLDFRPLSHQAGRLKHVVCYGEAGPRIQRQLGLGTSETLFGFEDAVERAAAVCEPGDTLLLSPGCVSWDQFPSYEVRGQAFKHLAVGLLSTRGCTRLCTDSRDVHAGAAFIAIEGREQDGHCYIEDAMVRGARVVLHKQGRATTVSPGVQFVGVEQPRELGKLLAAPFHGHASRRMQVVGVTGTNGKTTTALVLEQLYRGLGRRPGIVHTLGIRYAGRTVQLANVVPEPVVLQRTITEMAQAGVDTLILEVSSYALAMDRVHGIRFDTAVVTNVTRDHLDVHGTMQQYVAAKLRLAQSAGLRRLVLSSKCSYGQQFESCAAASGATSVRFGLGSENAGIAAEDVATDAQGTTFDLVWSGGRVARVRSPLLGAFNVLNVLGAVACVLQQAQSELGSEGALRGWLEEALRSVELPGRLERIPNELGATILVDYAHTDDGLRQVLRALRALPHNRLIVVFGCGGDRDPGKRPLMGRAAADGANRLILTSDNPRTEEPQEILRQIRAGVPATARCAVVEDREEAIALALSELEKGDILLVAGKGHERTQIIGKEERPFHDADVIRSRLDAVTRGCAV
jgi:UDP-N-acetylmuramoyl-L-alanyl-D-glutamate--2,6-diaminopimelate ligase